MHRPRLHSLGSSREHSEPQQAAPGRFSQGRQTGLALFQPTTYEPQCFQKPLLGKIWCQSPHSRVRNRGLIGLLAWQGDYSAPLVEFRPKQKVGISLLVGKERRRARSLTLAQHLTPKSVFNTSRWSKPTFLLFSGQGWWHWGQAHGDQSSLVSSGWERECPSEVALLQRSRD